VAALSMGLPRGEREICISLPFVAGGCGIKSVYSVAVIGEMYITVN
jgi:hypothetical protein